MDSDRIYYSKLKCYAEATEKQRKINHTSAFYDMSGIESEGLKKELRAFVLYRGKEVSFSTILTDKVLFRRLVCFLREKDTSRMKSFLDRKPEKWIKQFRGWLLQNGYPLTMKKINVYGNEHIVDTRQIKYFERILRFLQPADERDEREKDIWQLDRLDIAVRCNPIYNAKTINFSQISQPDMREETKKTVYMRLQYEALGTIQNGMNAMRQFSAYLKKKYPKVKSCAEIDREILEAYLIYRTTECIPGKGASNQILCLRSMLETVGKLYQYPQLDKLFLNTDILPREQPEFKVYSENEMKILNAHIARMDEQIARCLVIHQMLGTRISDTLTLRRDCLYNEHGQNMIRIYQVKTDVYNKPISRELFMLIQKAMDYTVERYGETKYIFVNENDVSRPMQYATVKYQVLAMIQREKLRDDDGKLFRFNSHMFRHYYGVKLTEMHLDDWTIAKLLGHKRLGSVQHYRKMSNQIMADETRTVRDMMTKIIYENLDGVRNMNKYDTMVTVNRQRSEEKIARARKAIRDLQMEQERITVPKLMKMTGLSRGFFYKNPTVRKEMDAAVQNQAGLVDPRRAIIDRAMEGRLELLEQQVRELQRENEELKKRNAKLQKAVDRKDLNFIKNL